MGQIGAPTEEEIITPIIVPDTVPAEWETTPHAPLPLAPEPQVPVPA